MKYLLMTTALVVLMFPASISRAQTRDIYFDVRGGYYFDAEEAMLGAGILLPIIPEAPHWYFNPNFEIAPGGVVDVFSVNLDFHYDFTSTSDATVWVGGGPAFYIFDFDHSYLDETETEVALNVVFGFGSKVGEIRPFVQGKGSFMDDSEASIAVGIRF